MMKTLLVFCLTFFLLNCASKKDNVSQMKENLVYFIPTLHNFHRINKNYSYDSLVAYIKKVNPEIIAVEIRPEDIDCDTIYLKNNYPLEMRQMKYWFPKTKIVGFDWLGDELSGKMIPDNYWKNISEIKKLERELKQDSVYQVKIQPCYYRSKEREDLLKNLTLHELMNSEDAEIVNDQYECYDKQVRNSKYQLLSDFYRKRNDKILENIQSIITQNSGKKILIVTGDDHYIALKNKFGHN